MGTAKWRGGDKSIPLSSEDFNPWPFGKDQLLTYISASQSQDTSIAAAEHAADDITQDACTNLGLLAQNKGEWAAYASPPGLCNLSRRGPLPHPPGTLGEEGIHALDARSVSSSQRSSETRRGNERGGVIH